MLLLLHMSHFGDWDTLLNEHSMHVTQPPGHTMTTPL